MSWLDQGRQEHGWFGHGQTATHTNPSNTANHEEVRARTKAAFEFALDHLHGGPGITAIRHGATRSLLADLVPRWANDAAAQPNTFRLRHCGETADPLDAWAMQRATATIRAADTYAALKNAGADLAHAMTTIGLTNMHSFLNAAQKQAALNDPSGNPAIRRIAVGTEDEREEEKAEEKPLLHHLTPSSHLPTTEESPHGVNFNRRIGGAAGPERTRLSFPSNPEDLTASGWQEMSHPRATAVGRRTFLDPESGRVLEFDKGKPGAPGWRGVDHYHLRNPQSTGKNDFYLDENGTPVGDGTKNSHIRPDD